MAKAKVKGVNEAIDEVFKDYKGALVKAMREASKIAKEEIKDKAISCLHEYYYNFEPNWYDRTGQLESAFIPYMRLTGSNTKKTITADVGMGYWSFMLDGVYSGSNQWNPVDGEWVLENYLKGIHPTTDGSGYIGAPYTPVYDSMVIKGEKSPEDKMNAYLEEYKTTFHDNVLLSFVKQVTRR